ncbi:hypothetical protein [Nonomuraea sp. NPDC001023]|uniref:hypothetical protein n=1 Tax=unclassified Nonomuraea TaxID=2593643 RepID=UPI003317BA5A
MLNQLRSEGETAHRENVAIMSPYQEDNVRRFDDYIHDLNAPLEVMETRDRRDHRHRVPDSGGRVAPGGD